MNGYQNGHLNGYSHQQHSTDYSQGYYPESQGNHPTSLHQEPARNGSRKRPHEEEDSSDENEDDIDDLDERITSLPDASQRIQAVLSEMPMTQSQNNIVCASYMVCFFLPRPD